METYINLRQYDFKDMMIVAVETIKHLANEPFALPVLVNDYRNGTFAVLSREKHPREIYAEVFYTQSSDKEQNIEHIKNANDFADMLETCSTWASKWAQDEGEPMIFFDSYTMCAPNFQVEY